LLPKSAQFRFCGGHRKSSAGPTPSVLFASAVVLLARTLLLPFIMRFLTIQVSCFVTTTAGYLSRSGRNHWLFWIHDKYLAIYFQTETF
jgi:hypothetical protein